MKIAIISALFLATLATCQPSRAESWQEYAARRHAEGATNARDVLREMTARPATGRWVRVQIAKPAEVYAAETNGVAKSTAFVLMLNPTETNALKRVQGMDVSDMVAIADKRIAATPAAQRANVQAAATKAAVELIALHLALESRGINFRDPDFGKPVYFADKWESEMLPSWWDAHGIGEPPTVREIAEQMK